MAQVVEWARRAVGFPDILANNERRRAKSWSMATKKIARDQRPLFLVPHRFADEGKIAQESSPVSFLLEIFAARVTGRTKNKTIMNGKPSFFSVMKVL